MNGFNEITERLSEGQTIKNWTAFSGYIGEPFDIITISKRNIIVKPLSSKERMITDSDFEKFVNVWHDYKHRRIKRCAMPDSRNSKYIISILRHIEK